MPTPSRAALFDLDGTVLDTIELILQSAMYAFQKEGRVFPGREIWMTGIGTPLRTQFQLYAAGPACDELIAGYREYQALHHDRLTTAYAGIRAAMSRLVADGYALAIVTSKGEGLALRGLQLNHLDAFFPLIVGLESTTRHKPDPEPVLVALERLRVLAGHAVFVGDSPYDIRAGVAAGVFTLGVTWGAFSAVDLREAGASAIVETPQEIPGRIDALLA